MEQDQLSNIFQRNSSNQGLKANNLTQPDFIISEEDLLSNIDRVSKLIPPLLNDEDSENKDETNV